MFNGKIYLQYGASSARTLYDLSKNSLDGSLVQALPGLDGFSGGYTTSCFEGKCSLKKHNIFSETRFARNFKFCSTKTVFTEESKVESISSHVQSVS